MKTKLLKKIRSRFTTLPMDNKGKFKVIDHVRKDVVTAVDINDFVELACVRLGYDSLAYSIGTSKKRYKGRNMIRYLFEVKQLEEKKKKEAYNNLFKK